MPYSGADDPDLPEAVQKLPDDKRRQWVAVFNSAYKSCTDDGGTKATCEPSAFAQAWGVVNKEQMKGGMLVNVKGFLSRIFNKKESAERMQPLGEFYYAVWDTIQAKDEQAYLNDIFIEDDGTMLAIIAAEGKLFKSTVTYQNGSVSMSEWVEVEIAFPEVAQSRTTIHRTKDGKVRWLSVSGSTVLNRSGQIDSKSLFDSFVAHIEETGEYPVRMFCHCGEQYVTGQCDFVARDENLLITSGVYNDTELAQREIKSRENDPEYWGESIGFQSDTFPEYVELAQDIKVPVFTKGVLHEISAVPEVYAAAWFTNTTQFKDTEVNHMLDSRAKEALVKLFDGDEAAADKWLEENVDAKNRIIDEQHMITRTTDAPATEPVTEPAAETVVTQEVEPPATEQTIPTIELDDALINEIVKQLMERQEGGELQAIKDSIANLTDRVAALEKKVSGDGEEAPAEKPAGEGAVEELKQRLSDLEARFDKERNKSWFEDLPIKSTLRVTHRPREGAETADNPAPEPKPQTYADVADATLARLSESLKL